VAGVKGGYFGVLHVYRSELAQTFWTAIVAWSTCFIVTIIVSMMTRPRAESELEGLVYSLTPKPKDRDLPWIKRPTSLAMIVIVLIVGLNLIFL
jgi:SSS family solute:Na+ symporter